MRLVSDDGASITLHPAAYQFEVTPASGSERDWDANWLMIQGDVRTGDGRQWASLDPCLTTWEARRLSAWLHGAARDGTAGRRDIAFSEPSLSFSLVGRRAGRIRLRVRFSQDGRPAAACPPGRSGCWPKRASSCSRRADALRVSSSLVLWAGGSGFSASTAAHAKRLLRPDVRPGRSALGRVPMAASSPETNGASSLGMSSVTR